MRNVADKFTIKQLGFQTSRGPPPNSSKDIELLSDRQKFFPRCWGTGTTVEAVGRPACFSAVWGRYSGSARSARVFCQRWKRFILTYSWTMFHHYLITIFGQDLTFRPFWGVLLRCSIYLVDFWWCRIACRVRVWRCLKLFGSSHVST